MNIDNLDTAHFETKSAIHFRHITIILSFCGIWIQTHLEPEDFISQNRDGLTLQDNQSVIMSELQSPALWTLRTLPDHKSLTGEKASQKFNISQRSPFLSMSPH